MSDRQDPIRSATLGELIKKRGAIGESRPFVERWLVPKGSFGGGKLFLFSAGALGKKNHLAGYTVNSSI